MSDLRSGLLGSLTLSKPRIVSTPEYEKAPHVYVRQWSGLDYERYRSIYKGREPKDVSETEFLWHVFCLAACDENGAAVVEADDKALILAGPLAPLRRVVEAALEFNGIWTSDEARAKN